ncbi:MAG: CPBP family glutamic-type intramembrane protease, partial [bacterium]
MILKKPLFWIIFIIAAVICTLFSFKYFPSAFPLVTLDLKMDRKGALDSAGFIAAKFNLGPDDYSQAASFRLNSEVQNFVELEAGGNRAFADMLKQGLYHPYTWAVRHYKEDIVNETLIRFTPNGKPCGFREKLSEAEPGSSLTMDTALTIAEYEAKEKWKIDLSAYKLVEKSREDLPGGRTDYRFVYERTDVKIGEGTYRLRLVTGGHRLTELTHFINIPESFSRRYKQMRSANNTMAFSAMAAMGIIYILGGCIIGLFFLYRHGLVLWRQALFWGVTIALLQVFSGLNDLPLAWMDYDTALSAKGFLLKEFIQLFAVFIQFTVLLTITFMAAEGLTRTAFPGHIQFWRLWAVHNANSQQVTGRTSGGYLLIPLFFAFEVILYFISNKFLGWWSPSSALFNPDIMASYFPWLGSISGSLFAGFWEECMFRAVPIAGAALIGKRLGRRKLWIFGAFILQAIIFGAGHADYPTQPAYARLVELIIPSMGFGLLYLYFGLLPSIILHFSFDVVWLAMPLFISTAQGGWINKIMVAFFALIPVWIVIGSIIRRKKWSAISGDDYNGSWKPPLKAVKTADILETFAAGEISSRKKNL